MPPEVDLDLVPQRATEDSPSTWSDPVRDRRWRTAGPLLRTSFWTLVGLDAVLALEAFSRGPLMVTTGTTLACSILFTLALVFALDRLRFPRGPVTRLQVVLLAAQALHAVGHLHSLYHDIPNYDDVFHVLSMFAIGLVTYDFARSERFLFTTRIGPARTAVLVALVVGATAGAWEMFEWAGDLAFGSREQDDLFDTMQDMALGVVGGVVAAFSVNGALKAEARHLRSAVTMDRAPNATRSRT